MIVYDEVIEAKPHTFGWLRVSDHDEIARCENDPVYYEAWERPDGRIAKIARQHPDVPLNTFLFMRHRGEAPVLVWPRNARQI